MNPGARMLVDLPKITFLPVDKLVIHERHDDQRTRPLVLRIRSSGVFRNPPIVAPLQDGSGRYMVLDGANRTTALLEMGYPHALVQVVEPGDPGLSLQNWNHVVWEMNAERFLASIQDLPDIELVPTPDSEAEASLEGECSLVVIQDNRGGTFLACAEQQELEFRVGLLNAIVDTYRESARLDRTSIRRSQPLRDIYPQFCGLVIFPSFEIEDLLRLAGAGLRLPSGITRFTISPRAMHLNYPLEALADSRPLEEKNAELKRWTLERLARKGVRYYAETTFLFDE